MPADAPDDETGIGQVALRVEDLGESASFYSSVVGLHPMQRDEEGAVLGAGGDPLLRLIEAPEAEPRSLAQAGLFHVAFRVPTRADLAEALTRIRRAWRLSGASDHRVSESLYLTDPEGNGVEVYRDRPREKWPETSDGSVGMTTEPLDLRALAGDRPPDPASSVPSGADVGHVHLEATDLDASERFYREGLGMGVRDRYGSEAVFLAFGDYHHHVAVNTWNGRTDPAGGRGLAWFEVRAPDADAEAEVAARLEATGLTVEGGAGGVETRDPDGIPVRVLAP